MPVGMLYIGILNRKNIYYRQTYPRYVESAPLYSSSLHVSFTWLLRMEKN